MKTKYLFLAAAAMTFAACSNDESTDNWNGEIRLSSTLNVQDATRAGTSIQNTAFDDGESIDVYVSEVADEGQTDIATYAQPAVYTTSGTSGAMNCSAGSQYYPSSGNDVNIYAVYPSTNTTATGTIWGTTTDNETTFTIQTDQSSDANYKASDLMYGAPTTNPVSRSSSAVPLTFSHLLSKVNIKLISGDGSPVVTGATVKLLSVYPTTTFTATTTAGTIGTATGTASSITVMTTTAESLEGSAIIIPQTLQEEFIEITLANGGTYKGKLSTGAPTLEAGNEYTYEITVSSSELTISTTIGEWTSRNTITGTASIQ